MNILGVFLSLKWSILVEKILPIFLNLNFTPNTLGFYGLTRGSYLLTTSTLIFLIAGPDSFFWAAGGQKAGLLTSLG